MPRKKWSPKTDITPTLLKLREKRKWQIALRRYVLEANPSPYYAPYFGLDIQNLRKWFESQFNEHMSWEDFGRKWQFDHIIAVNYFDFSVEEELKLCWNFTNLRAEPLHESKDRGNRVDILAARSYFTELYQKTLYVPCLKLLEKVESIEISKITSAAPQEAFILQHRAYLDAIEDFKAFEFELLNRGRNIEEVKKETEFLKKFDK